MENGKRCERVDFTIDSSSSIYFRFFDVPRGEDIFFELSFLLIFFFFSVSNIGRWDQDFRVLGIIEAFNDFFSNFLFFIFFYFLGVKIGKDKGISMSIDRVKCDRGYIYIYMSLICVLVAFRQIFLVFKIFPD